MITFNVDTDDGTVVAVGLTTEEVDALKGEVRIARIALSGIPSDATLAIFHRETDKELIKASSMFIESVGG